MSKIPKIELLSPAGNLEKMRTAFAFGADAIYLGVPDFSLRARLNEFDGKSIASALKTAHEMDKKAYVTLNIFAHNRHLPKLEKHIGFLKKIGVDGIIISDPGIIIMAKRIWPRAPIHLSTQANCLNVEAAKFWQKQGVKRIILGRETTLKDIETIHKRVPGLELEYFVHGAMCMAYSGRCFLSKYLTDRSANLGDCIQPCRWKYEIKSKVESQKSKVENTFITPIGELNGFELVEDEHGSHILNSEDLCLIKHLEKLVRAGITSFKIEGRTKSVNYVGQATGAYGKAMELLGRKGKKVKKTIDFLYNELDEKLYHRGLSEGFLFGQGSHSQNLKNSHKIPQWEFCGQALESRKLKVACPRRRESRKYLIKIRVHNSIYIGNEMEIIMPYYDIIKMKVEKMVDAATGELVQEAHGGKGQIVIIESDSDIPEYSLIRRRISHNA